MPDPSEMAHFLGYDLDAEACSVGAVGADASRSARLALRLGAGSDNSASENGSSLSRTGASASVLASASLRSIEDASTGASPATATDANIGASAGASNAAVGDAGGNAGASSNADNKAGEITVASAGNSAGASAGAGAIRGTFVGDGAYVSDIGNGGSTTGIANGTPAFAAGIGRSSDAHDVGDIVTVHAASGGSCCGSEAPRTERHRSPLPAFGHVTCPRERWRERRAAAESFASFLAPSNETQEAIVPRALDPKCARGRVQHQRFPSTSNDAGVQGDGPAMERPGGRYAGYAFSLTP